MREALRNAGKKIGEKTLDSRQFYMILAHRFKQCSDLAASGYSVALTYTMSDLNGLGVPCLRMCIYIYIHTYTCIHTQIYIYIYIFIYIYCTHKMIQPHSPSAPLLARTSRNPTRWCLESGRSASPAGHRPTDLLQHMVMWHHMAPMWHYIVSFILWWKTRWSR